MDNPNILDVLIEAKNALEQLPKLKEQTVYLQHDIDKLREDNGSIANTLHDRESTIEELNAKIRSLEVERDESMFRELETEDKLKHAKITLENITGRASQYLEAIKPAIVDVAKVEAEADAKPVSEAGESVTDPTTAPSNDQNAGASTLSDTSTTSSTSSSTQSTEDRDGHPEQVDDPSLSNDVEPSDRYSRDWWQWNQRQARRA